MFDRNPRPVEAKTVAVIRTDRIGDLILSTPLFQAIKEASPECRVVAVVSAYALPVLEGNRSVDEAIPWHPKGTAADLRERRVDAAIVLNPSWASSGAARRADVPYRTGPLSRPSSFVHLNRGVRQRRSRAGSHQSELDAAFAPLVTGGRASGTPLPTLTIGEEEKRAGLETLRASGAPEGKSLAGLHPGSGDSSLRWPEDRYVEVGRRLVRAGWGVAVTGGAAEARLTRRVAEAIGEGAFDAGGDRPLRLFFGMLASLDLFVAPSTGPLHAAAALGVPTAAPYPPLPSQSPERWGPRGERSALLAPDVVCPRPGSMQGEAMPLLAVHGTDRRGGPRRGRPPDRRRQGGGGVNERISAVVITRNEEGEIEECLRSLAFAQEIVVVDSHSTDRTVEIARRYAGRVETRDFTGFTEQKREATDLAAGEWILNIDADERVSEELAEEIVRAVRSGGGAAGYRIPRLTWYLGKFIRHGTWYPDQKLRLFRKESGRWVGGSVHESVEVDGPVETLTHPILHYSFRTLADHQSTIDRFTSLSARDLAERNRGGSIGRLFVHPPATFIKSYLLRLGFLDGWRGLLIALLSAKHSYLKYARARAMIRARRGGGGG
ncbi:MAG: glycosyltransferase [Candidatus Eisenbacteria bacterium]